MNTLNKQRGATVFEAALGLAVVLIVGGITIAHFKDAKGRLADVEAVAAMPVNYHQAFADQAPETNEPVAKVGAVTCDLRVSGSCP